MRNSVPHMKTSLCANVQLSRSNFDFNLKSSLTPFFHWALQLVMLSPNWIPFSSSLCIILQSLVSVNQFIITTAPIHPALSWFMIKPQYTVNIFSENMISVEFKFVFKTCTQPNNSSIKQEIKFIWETISSIILNLYLDFQ